MSHTVDWQRFFQDLQRSTTDEGDSTNESLSIMRGNTETIFCIESEVDIVSAVPEHRVGFGAVGYMEIA